MASRPSGRRDHGTLPAAWAIPYTSRTLRAVSGSAEEGPNQSSGGRAPARRPDLSATTAIPSPTSGISNISCAPSMLRAALSSKVLTRLQKPAAARQRVFMPGRSRSSPNLMDRRTWAGYRAGGRAFHKWSRDGSLAGLYGHRRLALCASSGVLGRLAARAMNDAGFRAALVRRDLPLISRSRHPAIAPVFAPNSRIEERMRIEPEPPTIEYVQRSCKRPRRSEFAMTCDQSASFRRPESSAARCTHPGEFSRFTVIKILPSGLSDEASGRISFDLAWALSCPAKMEDRDTAKPARLRRSRRLAKASPFRFRTFPVVACLCHCSAPISMPSGVETRSLWLRCAHRCSAARFRH